jgi:hypothetical protein
MRKEDVTAYFKVLSQYPYFFGKTDKHTMQTIRKDRYLGKIRDLNPEPHKYKA